MEKKKKEDPPLKSILRVKHQNQFSRLATNGDPLSDNIDITSIYSNIQIYQPKSKCVKQYSYEEEKNPQYRNKMEDFQKIVDKFNKDPNKAYFSLFDGHGGTEVVEFAKERIYTLFHNHFNETSDVKKSLIYSFEECDKEIQKMAKNNNLKMSNMGSTGTVIFITKENDLLLGIKKVIYCANVGDTRCVLISNSGCKRLSHDHNCNDDNEINRIKKKGGNIINDRVQGKLSLTRALGDFSLKNFGVIATPFINRVDLSDNDKFIILCSDGVWDVLTEEDLFYDCFKYGNTAKELAVHIVNESLKKGATDNISCLVIML